MGDYVVDNDPRAIAPEQYRMLFRTFLEENEFEQITILLLRHCSGENHHSVTINVEDMVAYDYALAHYLINHPKLLIPIFEEALLEVQSAIANHPAFEQKWKQKGTLKELCHIRLASLPPSPRHTKNTISDIKAQDVSSFIQISGTIVRTGGVRMLEQSKQYECQNSKCRHRFTVYADPEQDNMLPQPRCCPAVLPDKANNPQAGSGSGFSNPEGASSKKKCNSVHIREVEGCSVCVDYQEIKVQDHIDRLSLGSVPRSIVVILQCDLVDQFNPGDDVLVVGTLIRQWRSVARGCRCVIDIAIEANNVIAVNSTEKLRAVAENSTAQFVDFWSHYNRTKALQFEARNIMVKSVCPQLFGLFYVKLSLLLALIGGTSTTFEGGLRRRSQSHMLIVGDPGCGKSQLLRFAAAVTPRSVITTGVGTTGAGLTCTAVRDGNDWCLEAGALVLSNDGVCCIDEFASIREQDRATIHEAMEQQTLSIAKAGMVVKLSTRSTVIACCNPKGSYDVSLDISANTAIASPLLSRFDIILILLDTADKEWDKYVSTYLLLQAVGQTAPPTATAGSSLTEGLAWGVETLKHYIAFVKGSIQPELTPAARCLLMRYYNLQRQSDGAAARTTVRLLESLLRLSEAHAKLMFREKVIKEDAIVAIHCISLSNPQGRSIFDQAKFSVKEDFSEDPLAQYQRIEQHIFQLLRLTDESLARLVQQQENQAPPSQPSPLPTPSNASPEPLGGVYDVFGFREAPAWTPTDVAPSSSTSAGVKRKADRELHPSSVAAEVWGSGDGWSTQAAMTQTVVSPAVAPLPSVTQPSTQRPPVTQQLTQVINAVMGDEEW